MYMLAANIPVYAIQHPDDAIRDMLIASHARALNCALVSNNIRELDRVEGLAIVD